MLLYRRYKKGGDVMSDWAVRISRVRISHFMNVAGGEVRFPCVLNGNISSPFRKADVLGIYGQNGSGKTAFIYCLDVLKKCLSGEPLGGDIGQHIQCGEKEAALDFSLVVRKDDRLANLYYSILLRRGDGDSAVIGEEKLSIKTADGRRHDIFRCVLGNGLFPRKWSSHIAGMPENPVSKISLFAEQEVAFSQHRSFIFSKRLYELIAGYKEGLDEQDINDIDFWSVLLLYGFSGLDVIGTRDMGLINLRAFQPIHKMEDRSYGTIPLSVAEPSLVPAAIFHEVGEWVNKVNVVLTYLIPGMNLKLNNLGRELDSRGNTVIRTELVSLRNGTEIPIRYESEGIKKILSFLQLYIRAYNNPSMTLVVDELDAGIFEYLLGEMLSIFQESGKGQIIFTAHNLRPMEVLPKESIICTTTDPGDRYVRLTNVKPNNNMRDCYYRAIFLGGEKKELYQETDRNMLGFALRRAGHYGKG